MSAKISSLAVILTNDRGLSLRFTNRSTMVCLIRWQRSQFGQK